MKFLDKIPWARIITIVAGLAGAYESYGGMLPEKAKVPAGILIGAAINAERLMAKRKKGSPTFDTKHVRDMVDKAKLLLIVALGALTLSACAGDVHLPTDWSGVFKKIVGHEAVTPSDKVTIYGTDEPPSAQLVCHEETHKKQATALADLLVQAKAIDNDDLPRAAVWVALYSVEFTQYGYNNRYEKEARAACEAFAP